MSKSDIPVIEPYNPLDKKNLGKSAADALLSTEPQKLPPAIFIGAGVYAIYYKGTFEPYSEISRLNQDSCNMPIYVGKAVPAGARKGGLGMNVDHGQALYNRLCDHYSSIEKAQNLNPDDFLCRYLVVDDIWIPLTESLLIERFRPLWNTCVDGFGNHNPGKGRYQQQKSPWDTLHEGREWAYRLQPNLNTEESLLDRVRAYMDGIKNLSH